MNEKLQVIFEKPLINEVYRSHSSVNQLTITDEMILVALMRAANAVVSTVDNQDGTYTHTFTLGDSPKDDGVKYDSR